MAYEKMIYYREKSLKFCISCGVLFVLIFEPRALCRKCHANATENKDRTGLQVVKVFACDAIIKVCFELNVAEIKHNTLLL